MSGLPTITTDELRAEWDRLTNAAIVDNKPDWWTATDMCKATGKAKSSVTDQIRRMLARGEIVQSTKFVQEASGIRERACYQRVKIVEPGKAKGRR